jgi:hypothetical protein
MSAPVRKVVSGWRRSRRGVMWLPGTGGEAGLRRCSGVPSPVKMAVIKSCIWFTLVRGRRRNGGVVEGVECCNAWRGEGLRYCSERRAQAANNVV